MPREHGPSRKHAGPCPCRAPGRPLGSRGSPCGKWGTGSLQQLCEAGQGEGPRWAVAGHAPGNVLPAGSEQQPEPPGAAAPRRGASAASLPAGALSCHTLTPNLLLVPQNLQWARDVLLGSSIPWQQLQHMPAQGLFCERNKTNFFNVSTVPWVSTAARGDCCHQRVRTDPRALPGPRRCGSSGQARWCRVRQAQAGAVLAEGLLARRCSLRAPVCSSLERVRCVLRCAAGSGEGSDGRGF